MPTYEYICPSCQNAWEEIQKISEPAIEVCPKCHQKTAKRQISAGNFILKGGGWYADLYSSKKPGATKSEDGATTSPDAKSDAKADTKVAATKEGTGSTAPPPAAAPASSSSGGGTSGGGGTTGS